MSLSERECYDLLNMYEFETKKHYESRDAMVKLLFRVLRAQGLDIPSGLDFQLYLYGLIGTKVLSPQTLFKKRK